MKNINIVYIDDIIDPMLTRYLREKYDSKDHRNYRTFYEEVNFDSNNNYQELINKELVRSANIILIDNHLFEEQSVSSKFSGKQFKIILRKLFPYIEVIVITQDESIEGEKIVKKFSDPDISKVNVYYDKNLFPVIENSIKEVIEFDNLLVDLESNLDVEKLLVEKIRNSINGMDFYDELKKEDIDDLIRMFKEIKNELRSEQ